MARVSYVEMEEAAPEVREIYEQKLKGKPGNIQKALAHRPELLKNFLNFYASVGRSLERRLFELLYLRVSMINNCQYCLQHHLASSKRAGLTQEDWQALKDHAHAPRFSDNEKIALAYAEKITHPPTSDAAAEAEALKGAFSEEHVVDIIATVALANLTNRMTDGLGLELEMAAEKI